MEDDSVKRCSGRLQARSSRSRVRVSPRSRLEHQLAGTLEPTTDKQVQDRGGSATRKTVGRQDGRQNCGQEAG